MTNLTATPGWDDVPQLETTTPVLGGPGGFANAQAQALLNRFAALSGTGSGQGSSKIGFSHADTYAAGTVGLGLQWANNVRNAPFNAVGDGTTDDTAAFTALFAAAGSMIIPAGTYIVNPLFMSSNSTLYMEPGAVIKSKTGYGSGDRLLNITAVSNVTIFGNGATLQMLKSEYTTGSDQNHCVFIANSQRVTIRDLITKDSGGDGFYVGAVVCDDIALINCVADNHRRNGLSITNVRNLLVQGGTYKNTNGSINGPGGGIDIESNLLDNYYLQGVNIVDVRTENNEGAGVIVTPQSKYSPVSINVVRPVSVGDGYSLTLGRGAISVNAAMAYTPATAAGLKGKIAGKINILEPSVIDPGLVGFNSTNWTEDAPETYIRNMYIQNPWSSAAGGASNRQKVGVYISGQTPSSGLYGTSIGNLTIDGVEIVDTRATKTMYIPIHIEPLDEADKKIKNLYIRNIKVSTPADWTRGTVQPVLRSGSLATTNVEITYRNDYQINSAGFTHDTSTAGVTWTTTASSNFVLPLAANNLGTSWNFRHVNAGNLQITPNAADTIDNYSGSIGVGLIARDIGAVMTLRATSAGHWTVVNGSGGWAVGTGFGPRYQTTYMSAAPTTGAWVKEDIIYNTNPATAGFIGWVCTVSGSPGTWKTFGVIS